MSPRPRVPPTSDRAVLIDVLAVCVISLVLCATHSALAWMLAVVPTVIALRMLAWRSLPIAERGPWRLELAFMAACIVLGAFNDWNSVHRHRVYDYTAELEVAPWSLVPLWMLLFWGMILRLVVTVGRWKRLGGWTTPLRRVVLPGRTVQSPSLALALELLIVLATRQAIYANYLDPLWSWLPFALALVVYLALLRPPAPARRLMLLAAVVGPLVEILYIQVGHLHHYALGWLGGVPLWIALWWVLAIPIWVDVSLRGMGGRRRHGREQRGAKRPRLCFPCADVVEQRQLEVVLGHPHDLVPRPVHEHPPQGADLGVDGDGGGRRHLSHLRRKARSTASPRRETARRGPSRRVMR